MRFLIVVSFLALLATPAANAQDRVAFANVELILALMPETAAANQALGAFQDELAGDLRSREASAQKKLEEAQAAVAAGAPDSTLEAFRQELARMENDIRTQAADADRQMAAKRDELMSPVIDRLGGVFRDLAMAESYDFILNGVDGSGTSIVLFGPDDRDVTRRVLERLGIEVPKEAGG